MSDKDFLSLLLDDVVILNLMLFAQIFLLINFILKILHL